jgi:hypothetical protein
MGPQAVFGISVLLGLVVWGIIGARDIWPALRRRPHAEALRPLLLLHAFRFVGLAFLVPGVVAPDLPTRFARPAAYGDLATSILALLALAALGRRPGTLLVWVFNVVGTVDLLNALSGQSPGGQAHSRAAGGRVLHSDRAGPAAPRDARPGLRHRHPAQTRCNGRFARQAPRELIGDVLRWRPRRLEIRRRLARCRRAPWAASTARSRLPAGETASQVWTRWTAADRPAEAVR